MKYVIPVYGKSSTDSAQWQFALETAGYKVDACDSFTTTDNFHLTAKSPTGDVQLYTAEGDDIITIDTNAPANLIEALWGMTGDTCGFIGTTEDSVTCAADLKLAKITATR